MVAVACGSREPGAAPVIDGILVSPEIVPPGERVTVAAAAVDPDGGALAYAWDVPDGWVVNGSREGPVLTLAAPLVSSATAAVVLTVTDGSGKRATRAALVHTAPPETAPTVTFAALAAQPNPVSPGGSIDVAATARSADGAPVTYRVEVSDPEWRASPDAFGARVTAPLAYDRTATVTLHASGATGGGAVAQVVVATKPWTAPSVDAIVASPSVTAPGGRVQLSAAGHGADGLPVSYAWTISGAGWTLATDGASATAEAPALPGSTATVTVTMTDAAGAGASAAVALATSDAVPVLDAVAVLPTPVVPGGSLVAVATAHDPSGATIRYAWGVSPSEWSVVGSGATASVRAPLRYDAVGALTVTASSPYATTSASVLVSTVPYAAPEITSVMCAPSPVAPGASAQLAVTAASRDGLPLSYAWSVGAPGWMVTGDGPAAALLAPKSKGQAAIVVVDVTDAAGATSRGAVAVSTLP